MRLFAFDTETYLFRPGRQAPRVVCVQTRFGGRDEIQIGARARERLGLALTSPDVRIVAHNAAFDVLATSATWPDLWPLWLAAYRADRVTCTLVREKLARIAEGSLERYGARMGLLDLVHRYKLPNAYLDGDKGSEDSWRLRYHELDGVDPADYPADARRYALADLVVSDVYEAQGARFHAAWFQDEYRRARGDLWLAVTSAWGMRTDPRAVDVFTRKAEAEYDLARRLLIQGDPDALRAFVEGWNADHADHAPLSIPTDYRGGIVRPTGSKATNRAKERMRAACRALALPVPITDTGKAKLEAGADRTEVEEEYTSLEADACEASRDPVLIAYARYGSIDTLRSRVARLRLAADHGLPIQTRFDVLKSTGRTSASKGKSKPGRPLGAFGDQTQNLPRSPGLRECYTARPGCLILSVDWRAAELHTLAQTCIDMGLHSMMADVLNSGQDIHVWYAAQVAGWTYEWTAEALKGKHGAAAKKAAKAARQGAKPCNFGFPGGLGIEKFRLFALKQYGVVFSDQEARERKGVWLSAFSEMPAYFAHITRLIDTGAPLVHFKSNRYRGDLRYTSAANSYFQGRCADMAMDAGWRFLEAIHLHGLPARLWNFAHDEFLLEIPEADADWVSKIAVQIMEDAGREWCPGAPVKAEPALQRSWRKGAEPAYDKAGRLIPWEDRELPDETIVDIQKALARGDDPVQTSWTYGITVDRVDRIRAWKAAA